MSQELLIIKNISREGPGLLEEILKEKAIDYKIIDLEQGDLLPEPLDFKAVVVLGGPDSANDQKLKMQEELLFVKKVLAQKLPYLGICLGLQVLVKAAGGAVVKSPLREIGFLDPKGNSFDVELTSQGQNDPLFEGLGNRFRVFHLHGETVEITSEMELLGVGKFCKNQVVKVGPQAYGIQCHFELTEAMFEQWIRDDEDLLKLDPLLLQAEFQKLKEEYTKVGKQLFENFLKMIKLDYIK